MYKALEMGIDILCPHQVRRVRNPNLPSPHSEISRTAHFLLPIFPRIERSIVYYPNEGTSTYVPSPYLRIGE